jgi:lipoyl(octanoyl) transferase
MILPLCRYAWLGSVDYIEAWRLQQALGEARARQAIPDTLLLLEHPSTYTLGRRGREDHLLADRQVLVRQGISIHHTDRGGDITYHGPGQLIGYPVLSLAGRPGGPVGYVRRLEEVLMQVLSEFGIAAVRAAGMTGVWAGDDKIAAIGVKVDARQITQHGFALNVNTDLRYFANIVPCGIRDKGVTSMAGLLGGSVPLPEVAGVVTREFGAIFNLHMVPAAPESLEPIQLPAPPQVFRNP